MTLITYCNTAKLTATTMAALFKVSGIHRPVDDLDRLAQMLTHADILWTAWDDQRLVGIARVLTDFSYTAYLSDLAVDRAYQKQGIGRELVRHLEHQLGPDVAVVLLAAPTAQTYYPKIGFESIDNAFLKRRSPF
ncbi:GNAT family N-acetyltransferase [Lactiplantibacillus daowaiensis]|uniref:GNAT family N-acetyltransferase n=1 Tax=Lactiplantibacillus daowaiensis TaxID=2559918 RepID=A0ABW1S2V0_9LACO